MSVAAASAGDSLLQTVSAALETGSWRSINKPASTLGSAFTPKFSCLRHPASAKLGHPSLRRRAF